MNNLNIKLLSILILFVGHIAFAQNTRVTVRSIELVNDCKEVVISFYIEGKDTVNIDDVRFAVDGKPIDVVFSGNMGKCFHNGACKKVVGQVSRNGNLLAWKPADVEIIYTIGTSVVKSYYSTSRLRYKKPIEERKSYLSFTEGGMKLMGHNNTEFANALSESPWDIYGGFEYGKKIFKNTFFTIGNIVYGSNMLNSMLLGCKYEKIIGKKIFWGQVQTGWCISDIYYYSEETGFSFICGVETGVGYSISKTIQFFVKSNLVHTNVTINDIQQPITGIGVSGGLSFYFRNRKN
jgi:hypothetical protein